MKACTQLAALILIAGALLPSTLCGAQTSTTTDKTSLDKTIDQLVGDHVAVRHLLADLQRAVAKHDAAAVAALVHYPIKVNPGKGFFTVRDERAFIKDYDRIITHDVTDAIFSQKYERLFVNSDGAMIGDGEVWISGFCRDRTCNQPDIKIRTIQDTKTIKP